jgi:hypothetical protein
VMAGRMLAQLSQEISGRNAGGVCEMNSSRFLAFAWYGGSM